MRDPEILILDYTPGSAADSGLAQSLESCLNTKARIKRAGGDGPDCLGSCDLALVVLSPSRPGHGRSCIQSLKSQAPDLPIIVVSEIGNPGRMLSLLKLGAEDFITPPIQEIDILPRIWRLLDRRRGAGRPARELKQKLGLRRLVGESPRFLEEINKIPLVARCDAGVLITGETGTGKEMCARAIHYLGSRVGKPFVPFNCGAVPDELMENELFGHVPGAFTGAASRQPGLISEADSGTLFLDDVDCLPPGAQVKLLRFLQEKEYRRLGSAKLLRADVRVIAATNSELDRAVDEGRLRRDLYYRLNVIPLRLPPLRERRKDIPLLARHFVAKYAGDFKNSVAGISPGALQALLLHDWPGNVRELEHVIERAVLFSGRDKVEAGDIVITHDQAEAPRRSFKEAKADMVARFEKHYIESMLIACQGNITRAARAAQKNRRAFWQLIRKHQIDAQTFRPGQ